MINFAKTATVAKIILVIILIFSTGCGIRMYFPADADSRWMGRWWHYAAQAKKDLKENRHEDALFHLMAAAIHQASGRFGTGDPQSFAALTYAEELMIGQVPRPYGEANPVIIEEFCRIVNETVFKKDQVGNLFTYGDHTIWWDPGKLLLEIIPKLPEKNYLKSVKPNLQKAAERLFSCLPRDK